MRRKSRERSTERDQEDEMLGYEYEQVDSQGSSHAVARNRKLTWLKVLALVIVGLFLLLGIRELTSPSVRSNQSNTLQAASGGPFFAEAVIVVGDTGVRIGKVSVSQETAGGEVRVKGQISGLSPNAQHGFHVHTFGDLQEGCNSTGTHFNPFNKDHGAPTDKVRHVGDLGNIVSDATGTANFLIVDELISLTPGITSIVGRAFVVHTGTDDLGRGGHSDSLTTGHAGIKYGCGVIGITNH